MYNDLADTVDEYVRFSQAEMDPYSEIQYAWTFARENRVADFQVKGKQDAASLETLESVFFTFKDPEFPRPRPDPVGSDSGDGPEIKIHVLVATGKGARGLYRSRSGSPSAGRNFAGAGRVGLQKRLLRRVVSSPFNSEFMEHASTAALPAYLPVDGHDLHVALTEIDHRLRELYPGRLGDKALMGYSMGAFESLYHRGHRNRPIQSPLIKFDRYVAINTPVRLLHGVSKLDEFYQAPLAWPDAERTDNIENTFLKVAALSKNKLTPQTSLPFNAIESKFLIGLNFRFILRDIIYSSQRRNNQGVLHQPIWDFRREPVYQEILQYSYQDYLTKFAVPYYQARGLAAPAADSAGKSR